MGEPKGLDNGADSDLRLLPKVARLGWHHAGCGRIWRDQLAQHSCMGGDGGKAAQFPVRSGAVADVQHRRSIAVGGLALSDGRGTRLRLIFGPTTLG